MNTKVKINIKGFLKYLGFVVVLFWILISYPLFKFANLDFIKSFIVGFLISLVNSVAGLLIIKRGINKPNKEFLKLTLGSMGVRLFLIAVLILVLLKFLNFETYGLVTSLLLFYFIFLFMEVFFLSKLTTKGETSGGVG
jgi:hypothetical protein